MAVSSLNLKIVSENDLAQAAGGGLSSNAAYDPRDEQIAKLLKQVKDLTARQQALEQALGSMQASKSWKLTAPLRSIALLKRQLWPLISWQQLKFVISPGRHISEQFGSYLITGPSAVLSLAAQGKIPTGWVEISAEVSSQHGLCAYLYYRTSAGFSGTQRILLSFLEQGSNCALARLPDQTLELRLDPVDPKSDFKISQFKLRKLGSLQLCYQILKQNLRFASKDPAAFIVRIKKALKVFRQGGLTAVKAKILGREFSPDYQEWVAKYDTISDQDRVAIKKHLDLFIRKPLISVIMPVYNVAEEWLIKAIESVQRQLYTNWELCIADDASTQAHVWSILQRYAANDSRIKIVRRNQNGHISEASNTALQLATGEYVALLDHDDELTEHALYMLVHEINQHPETDMVYSDEDKINTAGVRLNPYFKSDWNPDLFLQQNYICHLSMFKRQILLEIGGFQKGYEGAQDWDMMWRYIERVGSDRIRHVPHVLYHWRLIEGSTAAATGFKPYALNSQKKSIEAHLQRQNVANAKVSILDDISQLRVEFPLKDNLPLVSLIIPTKNQAAILTTCVQGILRRTTINCFEIIIVDNGSNEQAALDFFASVSKDPRVKVICDPSPFNYSRLNNRAVTQAKGQVLGFLNNDLDLITDDWLKEMLGWLLRPGVGAVGARLWYPNGLLQHAGVIIGVGGVAGHNHKGIERGNPGYWNRAILAQNLSAVSAACMLVKREVFEQVGGFDEENLGVAFNDVDLCLKIRKAGHQIVYTPYAEFWHYESVSRGYETTPEKFLRAEAEIQAMKDRWGLSLEQDPYYNPNLSLLTEDFALAFPPRSKKPWREL